MKGKVRVRFAPSPTGSLHIGGARTALFNWLFARHHQGKFILRIEDTDRTRSSEEATSTILEGLRWLGLDWDEGPEKGGDYGPYSQMERLSIYREVAEKLREEGKAYPCYCTPEELEERRTKSRSQGLVPRYDGRCRNLSEKERRQLEEQGRRGVLRFKLTGEFGEIEDLIHGKMRFDFHQMDDFVIMKSDGTPTYNFACVVDDHLMKITHVIRGDDHISNTPKQIALYRALGHNPPHFAHIPLILGPDRTRLSKRHGATALIEYKGKGFLPQALLNYLALLGWSPGTDEEIFPVEELIRRFSLKQITKRNAIFNITKLEWMNGQYIRRMPTSELVEIVKPHLVEKRWVKRGEEVPWLEKAIGLLQPRTRTILQIVEGMDFFFQPVQFDPQAVKKLWKGEDVPEIMRKAAEVLKNLETFSKEEIEKRIRGIIEEMGRKGGEVIHPLRVAITGRAVSPPLFEVMVLLGKEKVLERINQALEYLKR